MKGDSVYCDKCKKTISIQHGYYTCNDDCNYDVCKSCVSNSNFPETNKVCIGKHALKYRTIAKVRGMMKGSSVYCDKCKKSISVPHGYYTCNDACDYDVCKSCVLN